jgi:UDP-N-acetyl-D-glucosamine dehydrogenase
MELLAARGAKLSYSDPHIPRLPKMRHYDVPELKSSELTKEYLAEQDCVLIVTDHSAFDYQFIVDHSRLIVDTRNALAAVKRTSDAIIIKA